MKKILFLVVAGSLLYAQGETWTRLYPTGTAPSVRWGSASVYDSLADRFIVFGGAIWGQAYNNLFALDSTRSGDGVWRQLTPAGSAPSVRGFCAPVYDAPRRRMIVFGGYNMAGGCNNQVYFLDSIGNSAPRWSHPTVTGTAPVVRQSVAAVYDPIQERVIFFSGFCGSVRNDIFVLENLDSVPSWRRLYPTGTGPGGRWGSTAIYDHLHDVLYVFGGANSSFTYPNTVFALDSLQHGDGHWRQLTISGTPPNGRMWLVSAFDAPRDRMFIFSGGYFQSTTFNDLRVIQNLSTAPAWSLMNAPGTKPSVRYGISAATDVEMNRLILFGGNSGGASGTNYNDVYSLRFTTGIAENNRQATTDRLTVSPNPCRGQALIAFQPLKNRRAAVAIYDALGQLVRTYESAGGAAPLKIRWDGRNLNGTEAAAGIYFVLVETESGKTATQLVKLR